MGFKKDAYAKVWEVTPGKGKFTKVRISVSRKNKETDQYEQDFSGFCTFIGNAHTKAQQLRGNERIRLGDVDVTTRYDSAAQKEYVNYNVYDFEPADAAAAPAQRSAAPVESNPTESAPGNDGLPF